MEIVYDCAQIVINTQDHGPLPKVSYDVNFGPDRQLSVIHFHGRTSPPDLEMRFPATLAKIRDFG